jgi:hypothetical protein
MEALFAHTYLILFGKLAVGGLLALAVPPFHAMERGFYTSTAAVYLALALLMTAGDAYLHVAYRAREVVSLGSVIAWLVFSGLFSAYVVTLFVELPLLRARLFPAAVASGFVALAWTAWTYAPESSGALGGLPFAASVCTGAAIAGASLTGMLLGHWYLIDTGMDLGPFQHMLGFCRACLRLEIVTVVVMAGVMWLWPGDPWQRGFSLAFGTRFYPLIVGRLAAWGLAALLLALIRRTLAIPQTMAATGLFYIEALVVAVGEICGHWLLFRTGLPL